MAKYDQKILKFLNQNQASTPTIIDMMTKLGINIADLSDALAGLSAQGLIDKRMNEHGIECWFPASMPPEPLPSPALTSLPAEDPAAPVKEEAIPAAGKTEAVPADKSEAAKAVEPANAKPAPELRGISGEKPDPMPITRPEAEPEAVAGPSPSAETPAERPAEIPSSENPAYPTAPLFQAPVAKGVGYLTFAVGLVLAVALSAWLGSMFAGREIQKASKTLVHRKAFVEAHDAFLDFEGKTKAQMAAMEEQLIKLTEQVTTMQAFADSLKVVEAAEQARLAKAKSSPRSSKTRRSRIRK